MILRIIFTLLIGASLCCCIGRPVTAHPASPAPASVKDMEGDILQYINDYRKSKELTPLVANEYIAVQAKKHSEDMAGRKTPFGHKGLQERMNIITQQIGIRSIAENVASGNMTAREVVDGWLHSPGHRQNIEGPYTLTGIGIARDDNGQVFFTQIFAGK